MNKKVNFKFNDNQNLWLNDEVQFSRLLSEIYHSGLNEYQYVELCESTGLGKTEINQIFERAQDVWNTHKLNNI